LRIQGDKEALVEAAQSVLRILRPAATLPVLGGIKITASDSGVELVGTDLEIFGVLEAEFAVEEPGDVVVPGRLFAEIARSLSPGRVTVSGNESEVKVSGGSSEFVLSGLPVADFPTVPEFGEGPEARVAGAELGRALRQIVRAASTDQARPVLTGVLWSFDGGALRLVATDSYRLAVRELTAKEAPDEGSAIVPGRALGEFGRYLAGVGEGEALVRFGESQVEFTVGRSKLTSRLIEGEFPNYRQLLPDGYPHQLVAHRSVLLEAVERVGLVVQASTPVKLHLDDEVKVTAVEAGVGEGFEVVAEAEYRGEPMVAAFNPRFLADGLESVDTDKVVMEFADPLKPAVVKAEGRDDFVYLVMPVRLAR
jgi:DNA polymerase-3 subunit beta